MPTAKFSAEPDTPEYVASDWLITIHNAYRAIDFAIEKSPHPVEFIEKLRERVRRDYEQNREQMGWSERTRDIAARFAIEARRRGDEPNVSRCDGSTEHARENDGETRKASTELHGLNMPQNAHTT